MKLRSKYLCLLVLSCSISFQSIGVNGFVDPITGSLVLGAAFAGYYMRDKIPLFNKCPKTIDFLKLEQDMNQKFFGQHIASKIILSALKGNSDRSKFNKKPLVMTFHGWTGSGKNFIADLIANHMFSNEKVKKLRYHLINGRREFPLESQKTEYKFKLRATIISAIKSCDTNLFVFDEIQFIPMGILDIVIPILENHDMSVDSRNSIFLFLTNAGADSIVKKTLELWHKGYSRKQMKIQDFDRVLQVSAFNEIGGLKKSQLIDSHIIDHYIPFLPLEKIHVQQCIKAEVKILNQSMDSKKMNEILQLIPFGPQPENLFSTSGCKRINALVTTHLNTE